jgi:hypothetical protein
LKKYVLTFPTKVAVAVPPEVLVVPLALMGDGFPANEKFQSNVFVVGWAWLARPATALRQY